MGIEFIDVYKDKIKIKDEIKADTYYALYFSHSPETAVTHLEYYPCSFHEHIPAPCHPNQAYVTDTEKEHGTKRLLFDTVLPIVFYTCDKKLYG